MTTEERIEKLEQRMETLEKLNNDKQIEQIKINYDLKELIREAVHEGSEKLLSILNEHNDRLTKLEHQEGEKAKSILRAILTTSLAWFITGILTHLPSMFK